MSSPRIGLSAPPADGTPDRDGPDDPMRPRRLEWAVLLRRSWGIDALACAACGSTMQLISVVDDEFAARKILEHLCLPSTPPPRGRPWRPQRPRGGDREGAVLVTPPSFDGTDPPAWDG